LQEPIAQLEMDDVPFRGIVEQSLAGVYVVIDERFMYANDTFAAMFGYARDAFIGRRMVDCVTPDSVDEVMRNYRLRISGEVSTIHYFTKGLRSDGSIVYLELHASGVECRGQPALAGVAIDITERVQRQQELRRSREQLRELAQHINQTREAERARLAREVHDVLGGMLTSVKFDLTRIVRRSLGPGQQELNGIATDLVALVQETIDTAREISEEMRPNSLDLLGLPAALRQALERFGSRHQVAVSMTQAGHEVAVSGTAATQIYRIVQEALTNVARHAGASRVELALRFEAAGLDLQLADDGCGIQSRPARPGAIGLFSMAERAREIGGALTVAAQSSGGTIVHLHLPATSLAAAEPTTGD
jgi:two-component system, NarL family, sensor histidine kinase UhpB